MSDNIILWSDMHSNLHHEDIALLPEWTNHMRNAFDFWAVVYYPFYMRRDESGLSVEDIYGDDIIQKDWRYIREVADEVNAEGFPMFMAYEWQGNGLDGDHNVFFLDNDGRMRHPLRYDELEKTYRGKDVIAIPHHTAYQLSHRGKNWSTQLDSFSPLAEIYSSHGSSENDRDCVPMDRHIHMGPRSEPNTLESGWRQGCKFGVIASGDNHSCPGIHGFGYAAVLAKSRSKEDIWDALVNRRTYGVSRDRIELRLTLDEKDMGQTVTARKDARLHIGVTASNALDRIEIIKDDALSEVVTQYAARGRGRASGRLRFKFALEVGWGPDSRVFPDIEKRRWSGSLHTPGKLLNVEKCWSSFGQNLGNVTENSCEFELTSHITTATGKWMGPSAATNEGFIFEIEDDADSAITLVIEGREYRLSVRELLNGSMVIPMLDEARELLNERFGFSEYYRSDPWWHNSYKIKLGQAVPSEAYTMEKVIAINTTDCQLVRVRVWQRNGSVAWSSPFFIQGAE